MTAHRAIRPPAILATLCLLLGSAALATAPLKLATLVPDGSIWDRALKEMGSEWSAATDGRVSLRIYPGGVAGDEADVVRKMRIGQLHAAALTVSGLSEIDSAFSVFATPLMFDSYDELLHILERLEPELERRLEAKGFVLVHWGHGGWVHLFSKRPARSLADVKSMKMFAWAGDDPRVQLWRQAGFHPVALASTDILIGLQTGLIEAFPTPPLAALSLQWFRETPYMSEIGLAPLVGAVVVSKRSWDRITAEDRARLESIAQRYEDRLATEVPEQDELAIEQMVRRGLEVVAVEDPAAWKAAAELFAEASRGELVPASILDSVLAEIEAFRRSAAEENP
ncbi:MAG: TRAP transporter substrate-binding protein DctP [Acidobacteria bacterium]|nr:TRAP transporter substrate-binding protein DctP [Acidobacteriota bacterium]